VVNPVTGVFPSSSAAGNPALLGTGVGNATIRERLQVAQTDLGVAGALYFVSSTYIHPQDATNNTDNNSQSYRRVNVGASPNFTMSMADTTRQQLPAIFAWRDYGNGASGGTGIPDASVVLQPLDDGTNALTSGRFWVGVKVITLGAGVYRYEYAVYNHNSDRAASAFTVPIPAGAIVSNVGFSDVLYHSGEIQDNTDWTSSVSGSAVTWTYPNNQAQDNRENVLRWDTIYNFWFDCNAAPGNGAPSVTFFRPGTPASGTVTMPVPTTVGGSGNDACAAALPVGGGSTAFDTSLATTDGPDECLEAGQTQITKDIWFTYTTGTCTNPMTIETCGSSFDTKIAVYSACPTGPNQAIACNDDTTGCTAGQPNLGSRVSFNPTANTTYLIRVGGYNGASGLGALTVTPPDCTPPAPANDSCANAQWVAAGAGAASGSNATATTDNQPTCVANGNNVWFKYRPVTTGTVTITTCGSGFDTVLGVFNACGGTQLSCNDDSSSCGAGSVQSRVALTMTAGVTYWISVGGWTNNEGVTQTGSYVLNITGGGGVIPPANDVCTNLQGLGTGTQPYTTAGATTDALTQPSCGTVNNDIWYNHPSTCTGNLTINATGSGSYQPRISVYTGTGCDNLASRFISCATAPAAGSTASLTIPVVAGTSYTVRVGGATLVTGGGTLNLNCVPVNPNNPPTAAAGADQAVTDYDNSGAETVVLDGSASVDADGTIVSYEWLEGATPLAPASASPLLGASLPVGVHTITLRVTDDDGATATDNVNVTVNPWPGCNDVDFNNDTLFPDNQDLEDYLSVFGGGPCSTGNCDSIDFNNDTLFPDNADLEAYIRVFGGGPCL